MRNADQDIEVKPVWSAWPVPQGQRCRPASWLGTREELLASVETVIERDGLGALLVVLNSARRSGRSRLTVWFAPGVPMHATHLTVPIPGGTLHEFVVPAVLVERAVEDGLVRFKPRPEAWPAVDRA